jgi:hypothetical protein
MESHLPPALRKQKASVIGVKEDFMTKLAADRTTLDVPHIAEVLEPAHKLLERYA